MNYAPVAVFAYNRKNEIVRIMDALKNNTGAKETEVYVFSNAPVEGKEGDKEIVEEIRAELEKYKDSFKDYHLVKREINEGPNGNMVPGIDEVIRKHGRVIVLEDDILTAKGFLTFMNQALDEYEDDKEVFSICGYNPVKDDPKVGKDSFSYDAFRSWGYGLWLDRWESFSMDEKTVDKIDLKKVHVEGLMYASTIQYDILLPENPGVRYIDYRLACKEMALNKTTIYSVKSLCDNIGMEGTGVTTQADSGYVNHNFDINYEKGSYDLSKEKLTQESSTDYFYKFREEEFCMSTYRPVQYARDPLYYHMFYGITKLAMEGKNIASFVRKHNLKKAAIYGWGIAGKMLYKLLKKEDVEISFIVDRNNASNEYDVPAFNDVTDLPETEMIIVSAIADFHNIEKSLYPHVDYPIYCMDDVVCESLVNEGMV
ncbi:MAG: glycosyltransferase family 2 protein [Lachnospiraceae bacterium]|nr:glycosyltransferase family 2 protein [Lachnospiraceae bacterium]